MSNIIIGTAGHIDHGKTTLVKALSGRSTDNLKEEIRRGISINLGFTYFDLPSGKRAGIVDVPGHERFIKNMLAGAMGIDVVMLVIAANEGIKPQTVEHIDILSFLDIKERIVVLTKCEATDPEFVELVEDDTKEKLIGTSFEDAEIIKVDSISGMGIEQLILTIDKLADKIQVKNERAAARLNIDRAFSLKGYGTIVTGTLSEGIIHVGDELTVYPKGLSAKVRNIQVHEQNVLEAYAGQRTAINISNIKYEDLERGDVLAQTGSLCETEYLDVKLELVNHTEREVRFWERLRVHIGTREVLARVLPLEGKLLTASSISFCQLRLEEKIAVKKGDKFVVRYYSPMETIGGGVVIDPNPIRHGKSEQFIETLKRKDNDKEIEILEEYIENNYEKYLTLKNLADYVSLGESEVKEMIDELVEKGVIIKMGNHYLHNASIDAMGTTTVELLEAYHKKFPLKAGMSKEEIKSKNKKIPLKDFDALLKIFEQQRLLTVNGNSVCLSGFSVKYSERQLQTKNEMIQTLLSAGYAPPTIDELCQGKKENFEILESLISTSVFRLDSQVVIHKQFFDSAKEIVVSLVKDKGEITLAEFRDAIASSRKYAVLLLDYFDNHGFTVRVGDKRVLKL